MTLSVAIIAPVVARHDAISSSVYDTYRALSLDAVVRPCIFTLRNDYPELPAKVVSGVAELLLDTRFMKAEMLLYHFGVYSPLFDALVANRGRVRQIVRFHNVTPLKYMAAAQRTISERSLIQLHNLKYADEIWADSPVNAEELVRVGIPECRIRVIPLAVEHPPRRSLGSKTSRPVELIFVGRMVPAKGVADLIKAIDVVRRQVAVPFALTMVSNIEWSDKDYVATVMNSVEAYGLSGIVKVRGNVDDLTLARLYHAAHILAIPSYHEGFCKPVVEAFRAGSIPVGYASYNLPIICGGLGRLAPTGDVGKLAEALAEVIEGTSRGIEAPEDALLPLDSGSMSVAGFDEMVAQYVEQFTFERFRSAVLKGVRACGS